LEIVPQLGSVLLVFALLGIFAWGVKGRKSLPFWRVSTLQQRKGRLEVLDQLRLSPTHSVVLVRAGTKGLLLSLHTSGTTLLESHSLEESNNSK
jgi:flagellar biogenesis protein FliO